MKPSWTGRLIGQMHNSGISQRDIAEEIGVSTAYVSMILNGKKAPPGAKAKLTEAYERAKNRKGAEHAERIHHRRAGRG